MSINKTMTKIKFYWTTSQNMQQISESVKHAKDSEKGNGSGGKEIFNGSEFLKKMSFCHVSGQQTHSTLPFLWPTSKQALQSLLPLLVTATALVKPRKESILHSVTTSFKLSSEGLEDSLSRLRFLIFLSNPMLMMNHIPHIMCCLHITLHSACTPTHLSLKKPTVTC